MHHATDELDQSRKKGGGRLNESCFIRIKKKSIHVEINPETGGGDQLPLWQDEMRGLIGSVERYQRILWVRDVSIAKTT